jgi:hypothetical protein
VSENIPENGGKIAVVAFADADRPRWLRGLAKGFRHCFALVRTSGRWVLIDPMSHWTDVALLAEAADGASAADLVRTLEARGIKAIACAVAEPERRASPLAPYTCVEAVKRVLGIRAPFVWTPRQLFRFLDQSHIKMKIILDKGNRAY